MDIQVGAPPPPPPPPPPPAAVAVHPNDMGRKAVMNVFWKCLLGVSLIILYVKSISTSDCSYTPVDDILIDWDNTSSSMLPNLPEPMELQHFPVDVPSRLRPLLARFQVIHKAICGFVTPPVFASPCLFLRLAMDYLLCTLLCWILSSICALASGSACNGIHQAEEDEIVTVEVSLSQQVFFLLILFMFKYSYISSAFFNCPVKTSLHRWTNLKTFGILSRYVLLLLFASRSCIMGPLFYLAI